MWNILVLTMLAALGSFYVSMDKEALGRPAYARASRLAESMEIYRNAVAGYFHLHPDQVGTSVPPNALEAKALLPAWSANYADPEIAAWGNYRAMNGLIYIYAAAPPPVNIAAEIVAQSRNSPLAGVFRKGDTHLYSPIYGDTQIPLPPPSELAIPVGSPVWIAMRN